jgi:hypothetical protein
MENKYFGFNLQFNDQNTRTKMLQFLQKDLNFKFKQH